MLISFLEKCVFSGVTVPRLTVQIGILNIIYSLKIEYIDVTNSLMTNIIITQTGEIKSEYMLKEHEIN